MSDPGFFSMIHPLRQQLVDARLKNADEVAAWVKQRALEMVEGGGANILRPFVPGRTQGLPLRLLLQSWLDWAKLVLRP